MNQAEPEGGQRCAKTGGKAFGLPYHELLEFMGRFSYNFARHPEEQRYNESLPTLPMNQAEPASRQRCTKAGDKVFGLPYNDLVDFMGRFSYNFSREISAKVCVATTNFPWDFFCGAGGGHDHVAVSEQLFTKFLAPCRSLTLNPNPCRTYINR